MFLYGTSDKESVGLIQAGVPLSLITMLKERNLLNEIGFDQYGNISISAELRHFSNEVDDYTRFEIDQSILAKGMLTYFCTKALMLLGVGRINWTFF